MPTKLLHNDASLISGQDHATNWKKQPDSAFYESDTSFSQTSGTFSNGGITSVDFCSIAIPLVRSSLSLTYI